MSGWMYIWLIPLAIFIPMAALTLVVMYREKKYVWELAPMVPPETARSELVATGTAPPNTSERNRPTTTPPEELPVTPFAMQHGTALKHLGYSFLGSFRHRKGGIYRIRYDLLLSRDRLVLAAIESGTVSGIKVNNLSMISLGRQGDSVGRPADDGRSCALVSMTNDACFEADLVGMVKQFHFPRAMPSEQDRLHRRCFAEFEAQPYSEAPLDDFRRFRVRYAEAAGRQGTINFLDDQSQAFRPSFTGALRMCLQTYAFQFGRRVYPHRWRINRLHDVASSSNRQASRTDRSQTSG